METTEKAAIIKSFLDDLKSLTIKHGIELVQEWGYEDDVEIYKDGEKIAQYVDFSTFTAEVHVPFVPKPSSFKPVSLVEASPLLDTFYKQAIIEQLNQTPLIKLADERKDLKITFGRKNNETN